MFQLTFLCPMDGVGLGNNPGASVMTLGGVEATTKSTVAVRAGDMNAVVVATVPTTFTVHVPKFYPHDPPVIYAER